MKYFVIISISLLVGVFFGHVVTKKQREVDPKVYVPGMHTQKKNMWELLELSRGRSPSKVGKEKSHLIQFGTTIAMYYTDGGLSKYPDNPQDFDFDVSIFYSRHLGGKYIGLTKGWQIPDTWEALNQSNSPFVFVRSPEDNCTGSADTPMFITRYGYQAGKDFYQAVYEDGHVSSIPFDEAVELWKQAKVWNGY